ncbi:hypothetical protein GCM10009127_10410 [Alteraurantiacibacter aestuarii]|uniref:Uncharacterized protein n=1 Tax=Alteraurantiacibacter aestuarii TaxID=650004 RepID=A0A844ZI15_9SPHN|nr:hypothetical protein [Alteraurantiacibacter aestuarii]MXO87428.1 hypothetical protein [Alteraurantiacibacter aestuarii]
MALFSAFQGPLLFEDASVFLHRVNYTDLPVLHYYVGYIPASIELFSEAAGIFPLPVQALLYPAFSVALFILLLAYLRRLCGNPHAALLVAAYVFLLDRTYLTLIAFSQWTAVVALIVLGAILCIERRSATITELIVVAFLAAFSPLTICAVPIFALYIWQQPRKAAPYVAFAIVLVLAIVLRDPLNDRGDIAQIVTNLALNVAGLFTAADPVVDFSGGSLPLSPNKLIWMASLVVSIGGFFWAALHRRDPVLSAFAVCLVGINVLSFASVRHHDFPLEPRYYFSTVVCAIVYLTIRPGTRWAQALRWIAPGVFALGLLGGAARMADCQDCTSMAEILAFDGTGDPVVIDRLSGDWTLAIGNYQLDSAQCTEAPPPEGGYGFRVHCNRNSWIYIESAQDAGN